ncbi:GH25 family lysozyme [Pediococcus pentosaceus]
MERKRHAKYRPKFNMRFVHHRRRIILGAFLLVVLLAVAGVWVVKNQQRGVRLALAPYPIHGCVIDQENGIIDFNSLQKQHISFMYLNATTGATYFDDSFNTNYSRIQSTDLKVGIVHNFSFQKRPKAQLRFISQKVKSNTGQLPVVIRVSYYGDYNAKRVDWKKAGPDLADLVKLLANYYGQAVVIKTTPAIKRQLDPTYIKQSKFWLEEPQIKKHNRRVQFVEYDAEQKFKNDHSDLELPVSYFNGSQKTWNEQTN